MKAVLILFGLLLMAAGLALLGVGALWSGPDGALSGPFSGEPFVQGQIAPIVSPVLREIISLVPQGAREFVLFNQFGYLTTVGVVGILVFLLGGLQLRNLPKAGPTRAVIRKSKEKVQSEVKRREEAKKAAADAGIPTPAAAAASAESGKPATVSLDADKLLAEEAKTGVFDGLDETEKLNLMVSMFHAALETEQCRELLNLFRPQLANYMELYRADALTAVTKQALELEIIRRRRQQEGISPDQFRTFDNKIVELEREEICYRYLPSNPGAAPDEAREHFGLVYDRFNHSAVQQKLRSEAGDWRGLSINNAAQVLAEKAPERADSDPSAPSAPGA